MSRSVQIIAGGIVGGIIGWFVGGGPQGAWMGAMWGMAIMGAVAGAEKAKNQGEIRPDELQVIQSSESATIPVIFGTSRMSGNYLCYDKANFKAIAVSAPAAEGSKGASSDPGISGYRYTLTFDVGLCMGPVDALIKVQGSPGEDNLLWAETDDDSERAPMDMTAGPLTLTLVNHEKQNQSQPEMNDGGTVILRNGASDQTCLACGNLATVNYRGICVAQFRDFRLGGSPAPRTYMFVMQRWPVCLDANGDPIPTATFPNRGSLDADDDEYQDANPAACAWEILTNPVWGKGMSPELLNQNDFAAAAVWFATNRLGMSTALGDDQNVADFINRMRDLYGLVCWWDGSQIRARVLWDRDGAYEPRIRLTDEDIIGEVTIQRAAMAAATNEVRLEFTNRQNNYQREAATAMDLAHAEAIGGVRSEKIDGAEIGTRRAAELIAHRLLRQVAYPAAQASVRVRRTMAGLRPADFVELVTETWRDTTTSFWRVAMIEDDETGEDSLTLTLVEDTYATAVDGEIADFTAPIPTINTDAPLDDSDLTLARFDRLIDAGEITPVLLDEPNGWISKGQRMVVAAIQRRYGGIQSFTVGVRGTGATEFRYIGTARCFALTGTIGATLAATGSKLIRRAGESFPVTLNVLSDAGAFEDACSTVPSDSDGLDLLTATPTAMMVIGNEIIRVGWAEPTATDGTYTITTAIRGEFGTDIADHASGATFWLIPSWVRDQTTIRDDSLPIRTPVETSISPNVIGAVVERALGVGPETDESFSGRSIQPLRPELRSVELAGTEWTIKLRPRIWSGGAGYLPDLEADLQAREADLGNLWLRISGNSKVQTLSAYFESGSVGTTGLTVTRFAWIPSDGTDPETGLWELTVDCGATNPTAIVAYGLLGGQTSEPLTIPQP